MGQTTYAVMYGCKKPKLKKGLLWDGDVIGDKYVKGLLEAYKAPRGMARADTPRGDGHDDIVGIWVAVGGSGKRGCPYLGDYFALDDFTANSQYKRAAEKAKAAWEPFAAWCAERGVTLPEPRMWLVMTDVA